MRPLVRPFIVDVARLGSWWSSPAVSWSLLPCFGHNEGLRFDCLFPRQNPGYRAGLLFGITQSIRVGGCMATKTTKQRKTMIFTLYLYRRCRRASQEGIIRINDSAEFDNRDSHFNHLDEIPRKIRRQLESAGLTYDVDDNSDDTVITPKKRKRKVISKKRRGDR